MSEVHKFSDKEKAFNFSVKKEFLQNAAQPETFDVFELLVEKKMAEYLHNPAGPAIIRNNDGYMEFWLNGIQATEEETKKLAHNYNFNNKLINEITGEEEKKNG